MLPSKLKALRRALSETLTRSSTHAPALADARRAAETLERARAAELDVATARLTPKEFRELYGYEPKEAHRMRELAEFLAFGGSSNSMRH